MWFCYGTLPAMKVSLYTDGGSRGNPGRSACGWVIKLSPRSLLRCKRLQDGTNNEAEYKGLIHGLQDALSRHINKIDVFMDSLLVVSHMKGKFRIKSPKLIPFYNKAQDLACMFDEITFNYIPRGANKQADALANQAMTEPFVAEDQIEIDVNDTEIRTGKAFSGATNEDTEPNKEDTPDTLPKGWTISRSK